MIVLVIRYTSSLFFFICWFTLELCGFSWNLSYFRECLVFCINITVMCSIFFSVLAVLQRIEMDIYSGIQIIFPLPTISLPWWHMLKLVSWLHTRCSYGFDALGKLDCFNFTTAFSTLCHQLTTMLAFSGHFCLEKMVIVVQSVLMRPILKAVR